MENMEERCNVFVKPYTESGSSLIKYDGKIMDTSIINSLKQYLIIFITHGFYLMSDPYRCQNDCDYINNQTIYKYPTVDQLINMTRTRCSRNFIKGAISSAYMKLLEVKENLSKINKSYRDYSLEQIMEIDFNYLELPEGKNITKLEYFLSMPPRGYISAVLMGLKQNLLYGVINVDKDKIHLVKNYKDYDDFLINSDYNRYKFCTFNPTNGSYFKLKDADIQEIKQTVDTDGKYKIFKGTKTIDDEGLTKNTQNAGKRKHNKNKSAKVSKNKKSAATNKNKKMKASKNKKTKKHIKLVIS